MKHFLFLLATLLTLAFGAQAQSTETFTIELKSVEYRENGAVIKIDTLIREKLLIFEEKKIKVYENATYRYYIKVKVSRSGNRVKLAEQCFVTDKQDVVLGKMTERKAVEFINVANPSRIENSMGGYILIDKNSYTAMQVNFLRLLYYGPNQPQ
jgi:hypothetical protein